MDNKELVNTYIFDAYLLQFRISGVFEVMAPRENVSIVVNNMSI